MEISRLWLTDFRSYPQLDLSLAPGLTAICGPNGAGKTNLLEALGMLATLKSFRGSPTENLVRRGASSAVVRAEGERDERQVLIELELAKGRTRAQVNRQRLRRARDLLGSVRVSVFTPDDLALVKEGPALRRSYLDELLVALDPAADAVLSDLERVLRQRNALLRQAGGRLDESAALTLDVWDTKLATAGDDLTARRESLVEGLLPLVAEAYSTLAGRSTATSISYQRSWSGPSLDLALSEGRDDDVRRGVTQVGPHRDDVQLGVDGFTARLEASQGEQRTLALALRLAGHRLVTERLGEPPLLLLDDVLSELDPDRARALLANLPPGQTILTSASGVPEGADPDHVLRLASGDLEDSESVPVAAGEPSPVGEE